MDAVSTIGFLIFLGSLVFLVYHLIRKIKQRERILPKRIFYSALIGGFSLFLIADSLADTSVQDALDEALETNTVLAAESDEFRSTNEILEESNEQLTEENEVFAKEIEELTLKLADFDRFEQELLDAKQAKKESSEVYEKKISELETNNSSLTSEVGDLKNQVANQSASTGTSGGTSSSTPKTTTTTSAPATSSDSEWFQNCTELRKNYPSGVAEGHAAYQSKMDRDKDGWACER